MSIPQGCEPCWARQEGEGPPWCPSESPGPGMPGQRGLGLGEGTQGQFLEERHRHPGVTLPLGVSALQGSMGKPFEVLWDDTLPSLRAATATQLSHSQHLSPWHPSPVPPPAGPGRPPRNPPLASLLLTTPRALLRSPPCLCSALSLQVSLAGAPQGNTGSDKPSPASGQAPSVVAVTSQTHCVPGILTPLLGNPKIQIPSHRAPISQCLNYLAASCREGEMGQ